MNRTWPRDTQAHTARRPPAAGAPPPRVAAGAEAATCPGAGTAAPAAAAATAAWRTAGVGEYNGGVAGKVQADERHGAGQQEPRSTALPAACVVYVPLSGCIQVVDQSETTSGGASPRSLAATRDPAFPPQPAFVGPSPHPDGATPRKQPLTTTLALNRPLIRRRDLQNEVNDGRGTYIHGSTSTG